MEKTKQFTPLTLAPNGNLSGDAAQKNSKDDCWGKELVHVNQMVASSDYPVLEPMLGSLEHLVSLFMQNERI